jgi:hypothetical protein
MQPALSVYYNWELTKRREKDKRHYDLIAALRESPTQWGLYPEVATIVDRRTLQRMPKRGTAWETAPAPPGPCPLYKDLDWRSKFPVSRWKAGDPMMGPGASCPGSTS